MLIEHILYRKGRDVATAPPETSVADAVAHLKQRNIGALVVCADRPSAPILGIISERDIVRALHNSEDAVLERPVSDLMSTVVTSCSLPDTAEEVMKIMTEQRIRHIPVLDGGRLQGIVSIGDVVKSRIDELEVENDTLHDYLSSGRT